MSSAGRPRVAVLYHFLHPDDVVSARHFDGLCEGLSADGWDVVAHPSNRSCRGGDVRYPLRDRLGDVDIRRVWRPPFAQNSGLGRMANTAWMTAAWTALAGVIDRDLDAVIVGTDPVLGPAVAPILRRVRPRVAIAQWAFDLYPEAAIADGLLDARSPVAIGANAIMRASYAASDLVVDIGACMRRRIEAHAPFPRDPARGRARAETLVPWAISEPDAPVASDPEMRRALFGDARVGVLYSGNFGKAHAFEGALALARAVRNDGVAFCFSVRGNGVDALKAAVRTDDTNITFADFCSEEELQRRLAAADAHLVTLRDEWSGIVVPSKFFGALAAGRPVLFCGPASSSVAETIEARSVGWVLPSGGSPSAIASELGGARIRQEVSTMGQRAFDTYREQFSRATSVATWSRLLREAVAHRRAATT